MNLVPFPEAGRRNFASTNELSGVAGSITELAARQTDSYSPV